jgi:hypothetical protein
MPIKIESHPSASGIFTITNPNSSTPRGITLPDATTTLVGTDTTQTLTNKTLSGGTVTGATISGSTIQGGGLTLGTAVASTSGTFIDFTGVPSWAKRVTVMFNEVSTNGTSPIIVQLGDSGGVETTGYLSMVGARDPSGGVLGALTSTAGFATQYIGAATSVFNGTLQLSNLTSNTWVGSGVGNNNTTTAYVYFYSGSKTLSATLDRVRITMSNGTDTFDAGLINVMWEG